MRTKQWSRARSLLLVVAVTMLGLGIWLAATHTTTRPPAEAPQTAAGPCGYPAQVLDIADWKLTLPTANRKDKPTEITPTALNGYLNQPWFHPAPRCDGIVFRAPVNGATTSGSSYPRSELREMTPDGENAAWSSTTGTHTLVVDEAFTALPSGKPHLVGAQIHDGDDDVSVFRLEGSSLYVTDDNDSHHKLVTDDYRLGTRFQARYVVRGGVIEAYYNGRLQTTIRRDFSGAYFKVGAYTQANCRNAAPCDPGNYGETVVYGISVTHG